MCSLVLSRLVLFLLLGNALAFSAAPFTSSAVGADTLCTDVVYLSMAGSLP